MAAIVAAAMELKEAKKVEEFVQEINNYIRAIIQNSKKPRTNLDKFLLDKHDFGECTTRLSSDELIEMKEYLKTSRYLYRYKTSETFRTVKGFEKLANLADTLFRVRIGDDNVLVFIDFGREVIGRTEISRINRDFLRLARRGLDYVEAVVLAVSLIARSLPSYHISRASLLIVSKTHYTSVPLPIRNIYRKRVGAYAEFYIGLLEKAQASKLIPLVASNLLLYFQTEDEGYLYNILRAATQSQRLAQEEREQLIALVGSLK